MPISVSGICNLITAAILIENHGKETIRRFLTRKIKEIWIVSGFFYEEEQHIMLLERMI